MRRLIAAGLCAAAGVAVFAPTGSAQRPAAAGAIAMIVVLQDDVDFGGSRASYRADERAAAHPQGWGYLDKGVAGFVQELEGRNSFRAEQVYSHAIRGFSARLTEAQAAALLSDPSVKYIEPDGIASINAQTLPWGIDKIGADSSTTHAGDGTGSVSGVNAYVIDTGVDQGHTDLNVAGFINFAGGPNADCNGHGTHVAGTIAASDNTQDVVGVAPGAPVTGVKVLGCSGSGAWSNIIKGIDWVTANARKPAVANMSLGGGVVQSVDDAVKRSADSGVFYALAAGNSGANACNSSPARAGTHSGVLTVAATDSADKEASWSNYGNCVDIWAPGVSILSTRKGGGTKTMSGTSMASPHAAGAGALYLSSNTGASATQTENALKNAAQTTANKSKDGRTITRLHVASF